MRGCMRGIGCLAVAAVLAVVAVLYYPKYKDKLPWAPKVVAAEDTTVWQPLSPAGAARARAAVSKLGERSGPVFANLGAGDLSAYVFEELSKGLPASTKNAEAAVIGDRLYVRGTVRLSELGGKQSLGPLASMLGDTERVVFGGTLNVVRPGLAQYEVKELKVKDLTIPPPMIPKLLRNVESGPRPAGLAADGLPLLTPAYIADVRLGKGKVTLYKDVK